MAPEYKSGQILFRRESRYSQTGLGREFRGNRRGAGPPEPDRWDVRGEAHATDREASRYFFSAPTCRYTTGSGGRAFSAAAWDEKHAAGGVRHRDHAIALQMKTFDGRAADGFGRRDHHGGQTQAQQHGSAIANAIRFGVPAGFSHGERSCSVITLGRSGR